MKIDLSVLEVGDEVTLRNGKRDLVRNVGKSDHEEWPFRVVLRDEGGATYRANGTSGHTFPEMYYDIMEIHPAKKPAPAALDLTKAKKGDKVRFRCGGTEEIAKNDGNAGVPGLMFKGGGCQMDFYPNGRFGQEDGPDHPFDIIALEPAPEAEFDWATVQPGMAFKISNDECLWHFCSWDPCSFPRKTWAVIVTPAGNSNVRTAHGLVRAPEHDIKLPEAA